jgi:hypothetical protein
LTFGKYPEEYGECIELGLEEKDPQDLIEAAKE